MHMMIEKIESEGILLKTLIRILTIVIIILIIGFYQSTFQSENEPLEGPELSQPKLDNSNEIQETVESVEDEERPKKGISLLIGKSSEEVIAQLGEPVRIDPSTYGYEWWIYSNSDQNYSQVAIENNKVVSVFAIGEDVDVSPYDIGQSVEDIYRFTIIDSEVVVTDDTGSYQFELSEDDMHTRLLIPLGDIYAQLYLDKYTNKLVSVRYLDKSTLVKMRPYEMVYRGELINEPEISDELWEKIQVGNERQIFDISNIIREQIGEGSLEWDESTGEVASGHSKEMYMEDYFAHESPISGTLSDRLEKYDVTFKMAGENIAAHYTDGIAAVHGWLNSEGHRKTLLEKNYTHLGVGVYRKYYTQNFIEKFPGVE